MFKKNDFGSTVHNVRIDLVLDSVTFSGKTPHETDITRLIETGKICEFAREYLEGPRHVTENGYLLKGSHEYDGHPYHEATLNILENWTELYNLMNNVIKNETTRCNAPKIIYQNGSVQYIRNEGSILYLPLIKEKIALETVTI